MAAITIQNTDYANFTGTATNHWIVHNGTAGTQDFRFGWDDATSDSSITMADTDFHHYRVDFGSVTISDGDVGYQPEDPAVVAKRVQQQALVLKRAERLLRGMLTTKQRKMYERFGFFDVHSPSQGHIAYRIPKSGLIVMYEHGVAKKRLCVYEKEGLPKADWLVAAKMLCEADEKDLIKVANHHPLTSHRPLDKRVDRVPLWLPGRAA